MAGIGSEIYKSLLIFQILLRPVFKISDILPFLSSFNILIFVLLSALYALLSYSNALYLLDLLASIKSTFSISN